MDFKFFCKKCGRVFVIEFFEDDKESEIYQRADLMMDFDMPRESDLCGICACSVNQKVLISNQIEVEAEAIGAKIQVKVIDVKTVSKLVDRITEDANITIKKFWKLRFIYGFTWGIATSLVIHCIWFISKVLVNLG